MYIKGINSYKQPNQTVFELFQIQYNNFQNGNFYDDTVIQQAVLQVISFGILFEECSIKLQDVTKSKNSSLALLIGIFLIIFVLVQSTVVFFVQSDYDFQVADYLMCLRNKNINCGNNQLITSVIWDKNLSLLLFTPAQFAFSLLINIIYRSIWFWIDSQNKKQNLVEENKPTQINKNSLVNKDIEYDTSQQIKSKDNSTEKKNQINNKLTDQNNDSNNDLKNQLTSNPDICVRCLCPSCASLSQKAEQAVWISRRSVAAQDNMKLEIQNAQISERANISAADLTSDMNLLEILIDNGGEIVVDLVSFSKFNKITIDEAIEVKQMCEKMIVKDAMFKFMTLNKESLKVKMTIESQKDEN